MAEYMSDVVRIAFEFREQLARNEDEMLRQMARYWARMEKELEDGFRLLAQDIEDLKDSGQAVPMQYIYSMRRYQEMMAQIAKELPEYDQQAVDIITKYQRENFNLGLDDASAIIRASKPSDSIWNRVGKDAVEMMAGFAGNGAPLQMLLQHDYGDLGQAVTDALITGIGLGKGAYATAKDIRDAMGMEFSRSVRIARTETNRAYRLANAQQYAKSGVVEKVLRLCYPPTACLACLVMDGQECKNGICDDHPNGKCTTVAVTTGGITPQWQHGSEWLMEQSEEDQRRIMGDERWELWNNGVISLEDMVTMKENPVWGGSPSVISVKDLKALYNIGEDGNPISIPPAPPVQTPQDYTIIPEFIPAKTRQEAEEFAKRFAKDVDYSRISVDNCNVINEKLNELTSKYPINELEKIGGSVRGRAIMRAWYEGLEINRKAISESILANMQRDFEAIQNATRLQIERMKSRYVNAIPKDIQRQINVLEKKLQYNRWAVYSGSNPLGTLVTHEYGHIIADQYFGQLNGAKANPNFDTNYELRSYVKKWNDVFQRAKKSGDIYGLSEYGATNAEEFFAESFSARELGEELPDYVSDLLEEILRNGIL